MDRGPEGMDRTAEDQWAESGLSRLIRMAALIALLVVVAISDLILIKSTF
jgi:hypothetical protein